MASLVLVVQRPPANPYGLSMATASAEATGRETSLATPRTWPHRHRSGRFNARYQLLFASQVDARPTSSMYKNIRTPRLQARQIFLKGSRARGHSLRIGGESKAR